MPHRSNRTLYAQILVIVVVAAMLPLTTPLPALAQSGPAPSGDGGGGGITCVLRIICENPASWLQQTVTTILTDFLQGLANDFGDAIVGFINQVNFFSLARLKTSATTTIWSNSLRRPCSCWLTVCWRWWCW
jgi:hypothetical protein